MRLILAEDSTLLREGLVRLLEDEDHEVLASVGDAVELPDLVASRLPDAVVVDVRMPPTHTDEGLRAALEIKRRTPDVGVLVLSQYVEKRYAVELMTSHDTGIGYLLKNRVAHVDDFLAALERVAAGEAAFDPEVVRQLLARTAHADPLSRLTPRETDVLRLMAEGLSNATISARLYVSQSAVEKHVKAIFEKLDLALVTGYSRRVLAVLRFLGS